MNVELRQLRYFVAVAEELHFTRAAERLHMTQQPLSAAIARLELQLGVQLLDRTTRRVALTEAGEAFLEASRAALRAVDVAVETAVDSGRGESGDVAIGMSSGAWYGLGDLFSEIRERYPGLRLHVRQQSTLPLLAAVRSGELDLAVGLCTQVPGDLKARRLKDEPVLLALPADHRLARRDSVPLAEVRDETFALDEPSEGLHYNEAVRALCAEHGFDPAGREMQTHHDAWERAIADGDCVGLTIASHVAAAYPGVRTVRVEPRATFPLDLVWRPQPGLPLRPAVRTVIGVAIGIAEREGWTGPATAPP